MILIETESTKKSIDKNRFSAGSSTESLKNNIVKHWIVSSGKNVRVI